MTGPFVSNAPPQASANPPALASGSGHRSRITLLPSQEASGPAMLAPLLLTPDLSPDTAPLVLTSAMQRDAFQMDHDRALRGNRAKAGRIAQEAKAATLEVLRKGTCSGEVAK